jgi:hypothetical protein
MKNLIKILILILLCVLFILLGCAKKEYSTIDKENELLKQGTNREIVEVKSIEFEKQTSYTGFKNELEEFKLFSDEFFSIWADHINRTSSMLDDFNSSDILEEKLKYSEILEQDYSDFEIKLENIKPPDIAKTAHNLAVEAVSYRVLFFQNINKNAPINELNKLENQAYLAEASFWEEINRIYEYFDEEFATLNTTDDNKYIVIN